MTEPLRTFRYVSLGAGTQSSALLVMSALGLHGCPRADVAIFADTQAEPAWVYEQLAVLAPWAGARGIPVITATRGSLEDDTMSAHKGQRTRFAAIPAFTTGRDGRATPLRRQCTREYKIEVIERKARELMGFARGERIAGRAKAEALIGISIDEADRMKPSRTPWVTSLHPLIDARLNRDACVRILQEAGLPVPRKSACVFCPYHDDRYWLDLKQEFPGEFERAARFDDGIRDMSKSGVKGQVFLHRSLLALRDIDFAGRVAERERQGRFAFDAFSNECEGVCGV